MKVETDDREGLYRHLIFSEIGQEGVLEPLETAITYTGDTGVGNAICLDHYVIPAIIEAVNSHDKLLADREALRNKIFALETNLYALRGTKIDARTASFVDETLAAMAESIEQMKALCSDN